MTRPRLLDLFCGAGGAAVGYARAGFDVVGVDLEPQPHYPFDFVRADALAFDLGDADAIHASPPCQAFSAMARMGAKAYPNLIPATRARLVASGLPYVIENVPGAPLIDPVLLCGETFGLELIRHRHFELSWWTMVPPCSHVRGGTITGQYVAFRHGTRYHEKGRRTPPRRTEGEFFAALGCPWMNQREARQAIPPAYTEWIGARLLERLGPPIVPGAPSDLALQPRTASAPMVGTRGRPVAEIAPQRLEPYL